MDVFRLCDEVRLTSVGIHRYLRNGHLERIYENALVHRLRKRGLHVEQQHALAVRDEDGTLLGTMTADLFVEDCLLVELKAVSHVLAEPTAQLLGYLRASRIEHGLLVNFGAPKLYIRKYIINDAIEQAKDVDL